ncbi:hypothetical protein AVEN_215285-1 [Araneus ventricosus]|uniref:Uncharacterized protein n=1 Tax=Araneus ventricosus TaxID=182803 RepID=A0A4Y2N4U7_ARAVE|nr:hypothetical protein AVEN_215285-1 [Araneus ventricosus]
MQHFLHRWFSPIICSSFIFTSHFEATRVLLWEGLHNFIQRSGDEDDTSPNFRATPVEKLSTLDFRSILRQSRIHGGFSVESSFEYGALLTQSRDVTTKLSRPHFHLQKTTFTSC